MDDGYTLVIRLALLALDYIDYTGDCHHFAEVVYTCSPSG